MKTDQRKSVVWLGGGVLVAGLLPFLLYWLLLGRVPSVSVSEARSLLARTNSPPVLVDVRPPEAYAAHHVDGAVNWPYRAIASATDSSQMPPSLKGRQLLLICSTGLRSSSATHKLGARLDVEASSVTGGMQAWDAIPPGQNSAFRSLSVFEQWLVVITAFGIKPAYTLISLVVIIWLWRQRAPDLVALRWGLIAFWLGENACAVNYMIFHGNSDLWEYLHNLGMAVCFSFATYAVLEGMDRRLIKYSSAKDRCAALSLCRACIKHADVPCGLRRVFTMLIPATIAVAIMPLCADLKTAAYDTSIMGTNVHYSETLSDQLFEIRYCPALAILLLTASWLVLLFKRQEPVPLAKVLFAAGMGPVGFGFMRLFLAAAYREDPVWANAWEEITELLFVAAVAFVLLVFRQSLFAKEPPGQANPTGTQEAPA
jgi:rhodanese-related sulfurtransferase